MIIRRSISEIDKCPWGEYDIIYLLKMVIWTTWLNWACQMVVPEEEWDLLTSSRNGHFGTC